MSFFPERRVKRILMVYRRQSCLGNMITAYLLLATKEFFLNREMKKLTSLSSDILVASIRYNHIALNDRSTAAVSCSLSSAA